MTNSDFSAKLLRLNYDTRSLKTADDFTHMRMDGIAIDYARFDHFAEYLFR